MSSKRYPEEFKIEAVKQIVDRGYRIADVAHRFKKPNNDIAVASSMVCVGVNNKCLPCS